MLITKNIKAYKAILSDKDFERIRYFIETEYGIKLPIEKKLMVQGRLQKRLSLLGLDNFENYIDEVFNIENDSIEILQMIDAISTNKTSFFRELKHFEFISNKIIPEYLQSKTDCIFRAWSAACSSGEEAYSLAMILNESFKSPTQDYRIWGSDISLKMLRLAKDAIYTETLAEEIPLNFKKKYLLKSKDKSKNLIRITEELRQKTTFERLNLMNETYQTPYKFDLVMLRNVLIYFDRITQNEVIRKVVDTINPGGYLILGHSESILKNEFPLEVIAPTIFKKTLKSKNYV